MIGPAELVASAGDLRGREAPVYRRSVVSGGSRIASGPTHLLSDPQTRSALPDPWERGRIRPPRAEPEEVSEGGAGGWIFRADPDVLATGRLPTPGRRS